MLQAARVQVLGPVESLLDRHKLLVGPRRDPEAGIVLLAVAVPGPHRPGRLQPPGVEHTPGQRQQVVCDLTAAPQCLAKYGAGAYNQDLVPAGRPLLAAPGHRTVLFVGLAVVLVLVAVRLVRDRLT